MSERRETGASGRRIAQLASRGRAVGRLARPLPGALRDAIADPTRHTASQVLVPKYLKDRRLGMTTANEQAYFEWYARKIYGGDGPIVDLGSWLGSTTIPLATGLRRRRAASAGRIHAYDRFVWEPWMADTSAGASIASRYSDGDSFVDAFRERIAPWSDLIDVHVADLESERWSGGPIEFLLIDAMKTWSVCDAIVRGFLGDVRVGGIVLHQDFSHYYTPWVHVITYRLRDYLEPVYDVPRSASSVFRVTAAIPAEVLDAPSQGRDYGRDEIDAIFAHSMGMVPADKHPAIAAAKVKLLTMLGLGEDARRERDLWVARVGAHPELQQVASLVTAAA